MPITLPRTFHDGIKEVASGKQVMENLEALKTAIEAREAEVAASTAATWTEGANWVLNTEYEPSAAKAAFVTARFGLIPALETELAITLNFWVGAVRAARAAIATALPYNASGKLHATTASFFVPAGAKWRATREGGSTGSLPEATRYRYLLLT
jgi:hypothetical protein